MKYIVANWKAHFTLVELHKWLHSFLSLPLKKCGDEVEIIICPPFPFLQIVNDAIYDPIVKIGSQDISQFSTGAYTGEVTATTLSGIVDYAIIGHSERREHFGETDKDLGRKCERALDQDIAPILCVRNEKDHIHKNVSFVAYEPIDAIGTGKNVALEEMLEIKQQLSINNTTKFLYGGSVKPDNAATYLTSPHIDGVLVGGSSLIPEELFAIALAAKT